MCGGSGFTETNTALLLCCMQQFWASTSLKNILIRCHSVNMLLRQRFENGSHSAEETASGQSLSIKGEWVWDWIESRRRGKVNQWRTDGIWGKKHIYAAFLLQTSLWHLMFCETVVEFNCTIIFKLKENVQSYGDASFYKQEEVENQWSGIRE